MTGGTRVRVHLNDTAPCAFDTGGADRPDPFAFHRRLPGYAATPLVEAPDLAARLGIARLWIKDESSRLTMPSFKILGASWAVYRSLEQRMGISLDQWSTIEDLAALVKSAGVPRFAAATDGNHGHAVSRIARMLGARADIFVPQGMAVSRIRAMQAEGANVTVVNGSYEAAVRRSAREAGPDCLVISDTSWPGYTDPPNWVIDGYATIFAEADEQLAKADAAAPDVVAVQIGVGALAASVVRYVYGGTAAAAKRSVIGVEPEGAACVQESVRKGELATVPGPHESIMVGLNCDTPSLVAWPAMRDGINGFVAIDDGAARTAMRLLADVGVVSGETGAAGLAGLIRLADHASPDERRRLGLTETASALVISTEGATDPAAYRSIVGNNRGNAAGQEAGA